MLFNVLLLLLFRPYWLPSAVGVQRFALVGSGMALVGHLATAAQVT
jgi:hypothetical protein